MPERPPCFGAALTPANILKYVGTPPEGKTALVLTTKKDDGTMMIAGVTYVAKEAFVGGGGK